jgi:hypothetical protein
VSDGFSVSWEGEISAFQPDQVTIDPLEILMNRYSLTIILVSLCLLLAGCSRHPSEVAETKIAHPEEGRPKLAGTGSESVAGRYEHLQGYTFLVPDKWEVVTDGHFLKTHNVWEIFPYGDNFYMVYGDQDHQKARFFFGAGQDVKSDPDPFAEFEDKQWLFEQGLRKHLKVEIVNLIENQQTKVNGAEVLWHHFIYASSKEKGDVIMKYTYKDGGFCMVIGTFSEPLYSELQKDITAVLESIKKE